MVEALALDLERSVFDETQRIEDHRDILTLCGSLVISEKGVLKLAHYSVKEYLTSDRIRSSPQSLYHVSKLATDFHIAVSCLLYLQHFDRMQHAASKTYTHLPLYPYCISHWFQHYKLSNRPAKLTNLALFTLADTESTFVTNSWRLLNPALFKLDPQWDARFPLVDDVLTSEVGDTEPRLASVSDAELSLAQLCGAH